MNRWEMPANQWEDVLNQEERRTMIRQVIQRTGKQQRRCTGPRAAPHGLEERRIHATANDLHARYITNQRAKCRGFGTRDEQHLIRGPRDVTFETTYLPC